MIDTPSPTRNVARHNPENKVKEEKKKMEIPQNQLREFVGHVPNLLHVDAQNVFGNFFRVNAWTKVVEEGRVIATFDIAKTFFIEYTETGEIVDRTIRKTVSDESKNIFV